MSRRPVRLLLEIHAELPELKERLRALRRGADEDST